MQADQYNACCCIFTHWADSFGRTALGQAFLWVSGRQHFDSILLLDSLGVLTRALQGFKVYWSMLRAGLVYFSRLSLKVHFLSSQEASYPKVLTHSEPNRLVFFCKLLESLGFPPRHSQNHIIEFLLRAILDRDVHACEDLGVLLT